MVPRCCLTTVMLLLSVLLFSSCATKAVSTRTNEEEGSFNRSNTDKIVEAFWRGVHKSKEILNQSGVTGTVSNAVEWLVYHTGIGEQCHFVDQPSVSVRKHLLENLKEQDRALEAIVSAIEAWEFSLSSAKSRTPLSLAITGPTGTGKTETFHLLAEALFKRRRKLPHSDKELPSGLIIFRGEDFSDTDGKPITQYHEQIKRRLFHHMRDCSGKALVVFDEIQKMIPHSLDVIMEAVSNQPKLTYYENGVAHTVDCSKAIFAFVSDIGADKILQLILAHNSRDQVPQSELVSCGKDALDEEWNRLQFGKMINEVIPFLPFDRHHIATIIALKLKQIDATHRNKYWRKLLIREGVSDYLAQNKFVKYLTYSTTVNGKETKKVFAKYGARNVETSGPIQRLKSKLFRYLKPFNPDADVSISLVKSTTAAATEIDLSDEETVEISIDSCYSMKQSVGGDGGFEHLTCVTKWKGNLRK